MTEPCANRIDVHAGAEEMHGGCMADGVRADPFIPQRRRIFGRFVDGAGDQGVDAVSSDRLSADVKEDTLVARTLKACSEHLVQDLGCVRP